ncbi:Ada metal-binding domain-containing protein [Pedobacter sp. L105]|uniref:Ada metal-binding domain-containing protein n=1 Tax=Pedobacter sp. L105 TaxID=1641871 RepID=UPI00131B96FB|nr:Ada metal-binding domain-containing protein [Pedobacter sp. L105]
MYHHLETGKDEAERKKNVGSLIRSGAIALGGYKKAKIYGLLSCSSGKRMKIENRIFFKNEAEALKLAYRPCGNCLPAKYKKWKEGLEFNGKL